MLPPNLCGQKCLVFGLGVSGLAAACRLLEEGAAVFLEDGDKRRLSAALSALNGARPYGGEEVDYVFRSPGIPLFHPLLCRLREKGARITGETELTLSRLPCPVFGVTGSNGKSTVTALAAHLLSAEGYTAHAGGNLGESLLSRIASVKKEHFAILELSSFQLEDLSPALARSTVLNVAEDHMDRHGSRRAYFDVKCRILSGMRALPIREEFAPFVTSDTVLFSATASPRDAVSRYPNHETYLLEEGFVTLRRGKDARRLFPRDLFPLRGLPFGEDLLAALALCHGLLSPAAMARGAETFTGLPHRIERVARGGGISFFDSSIDTSPSRTANPLPLLRGGGGIFRPRGDRKRRFQGRGASPLGRGASPKGPGRGAPRGGDFAPRALAFGLSHEAGHHHEGSRCACPPLGEEKRLLRPSLPRGHLL